VLLVILCTAEAVRLNPSLRGWRRKSNGTDDAAVADGEDVAVWVG
jgi:hypothetical protein